MLTYSEANEQLSKPRPKSKIGNNTYARKEGEDIIIRLHNTDIVTLHPDGSASLNSGGWKTVTTKARINEYLPQGWRLEQDKGVWYLHYAHHGYLDFRIENPATHVFEDGVHIWPDGRIEGQGEDPRKTVKLQRLSRREPPS